MSESNKNGIGKFIGNLKDIINFLPNTVLRSKTLDSDKTKAAVMVNNFFLHLQGAKTHINTLRPAYTFGMGLISLFLFFFAFVSGVFLMIYYNPSIENAFNTVKDIKYVVFGGNTIRNIHKWAGEGMILFVMLHMARVFFTSSYKKGREFNWIVGIILMVLVFILNFSGYLLPWDQLAYWAMVIGANIAGSPVEITDILGVTKYFDFGGLQKELFLGGTVPGKATLPRVHFFHVMFLPVILIIFLGIHFWRIRKDGGLTRPEEFEPRPSDEKFLAPPQKKGGLFPTNKTYGLMELAKGRTPAVNNDIENAVLSWPNLMWAELAVFMLTFAGMFVYSLYIDAPLRELANPIIPENPAKAPWYFLGLQELVSYSAFMGGIALPTLALVALALIPYLDREEGYVGVWFSNTQGKVIAFLSFIVGTAALIGVLVFIVNFGWIRTWWPDVPQLVIIAINPGTLWVGFVAAWSLMIINKTGSTRMGAIAMFVMFLVSFVILTYVGTELRGPNWDFYWSKKDWPVH
ncbi:MAG: cytochrome b N-terminal domain-containing protein [Nitrospirae bacterium]|nr:cytochrome b N-terminal domain-containing protein [Nitrospirota bacterium]